MLTIASLPLPRRSAVWGYGIALMSVAGALLGQHLMDVYWQDAAPVSTFLIAVIISSWLGGARPGLLAGALSALAFNYYYHRLPGAWIHGPSELVRLGSFALVAGYVVWITATERGAAESLRRAHDGLQRTNEALRAENLERRRTEEELRASEAKFRALWERAPAAMFISQGGTIGYSNPAASSITGYEAEALPGAKLRDCAHADFGSLLRAREEARQREEAIPPRCELSLVTSAGEERWLELADGMFDLGGQPAMVTMACDITERKRAENALRKSERILREAAELGHTGSWERDLISGEIFNTPENLRLFFGDDRNTSARFEDYRNAVHPDDRAYTDAQHQRLLAEGGPIDFEYRVVWPDGSIHVLVGRATVVRDAAGRSVRAHGTNIDVTERVRAERALHESANRLHHLSRRLLAVQEEERSHLSRELHDEFGQLLAAISLHLHAARGVAGEAAQASLGEAVSLLKRAAAQLRILALELRPRMLETAGLDSTLRWLAEQHQQHTGIATEVVGHVNGVSGDLAIACFRVVQEALTNIARHACAKCVRIELALTEGRLELSVRDDGIGFDVPRTLEGAAGRGNLGLVGMRERVEILGGALELDSEPGQGTRIRIALPLAASGERPAQSAA